MREIKEHRIYELLNDKYNRVCLDYVILYSDEKYEGIETHRKAVVEAFRVLNERFSVYDIIFDLKTDKIVGNKISLKELMFSASDDFFMTSIPYETAFLKPPHGTPYQKSDFVEFNNILFPNRDAVEVYQWNNDFSDYFDEGKEWWGTGFWTVYDLKTNIVVVIGASLTD